MYSEEFRELLAEFNLQVDLNAPANTRGAILSLITSLHPDKTGGSFADETQKEKFDRAVKLRDLFDNEMSVSTQMVPIQQVINIIEAIAKAQVLAQVKDTSSQNAVPEQFRQTLKRKYAFPKITSALIATLCFTLFTFIGNFKNSPFYRLASNIFANSKKVAIINAVNREGADIKMKTAQFLQNGKRMGIAQLLQDDNNSESLSRFDVTIQKLRTKSLIRWDDWPNVVEFGNNEKNIYWLEQNTAIGDVDLHSSDEQELFRPLERMLTQMEKAASPGVTALNSEIIRRETRNRHRREPERDLVGDTSFDLLDAGPSELTDFLLVLSSIQRFGRFTNQEIPDLRASVARAKKRALDSAERDILLSLATVTILACCVFVVIWLRERSDQRWVEFVSSNEGLELMFSRLCVNKDIASRTPPRFQLSEFTQILAKKDVPQYLTPALGEHLDSKELAQVVSALISRLKETKVITQVKAPTIQQWFEITAVDFTGTAKVQDGSLQNGAAINIPEE